jgi:hypothetical protein
MKHSVQQGDCLTRGMADVTTEMGLTVLAYNLKRVLSLNQVAARAVAHRTEVC